MFSKCVTCPKLGISCKKLDFIIGLPAPELLDWCKKRKNFLGLSNARLAEMSGIPKGTVDRVLAHDHADFKHETIRPILKVLVGGSFDDESCTDSHSEDTIAHLQERLEYAENRVEYLKEQIRFKEERIREQDKLLKERHDFMVEKDAQLKGQQKAVVVLTVLLCVALLIIIIALLIDRLNGDLGYFWRTAADFWNKNTIPGLTL